MGLEHTKVLQISVRTHIEITENKVEWTRPPLVAEKEWYNQEEDNYTNNIGWGNEQELEFETRLLGTITNVKSIWIILEAGRLRLL